ncbi:hypothetical protein Hanom_Chr06g00480661 [Helianthus anomalus]
MKVRIIKIQYPFYYSIAIGGVYWVWLLLVVIVSLLSSNSKLITWYQKRNKVTKHN